MTPFLVLLSLSFCSSSRLEGIKSVEDLEIDRQLNILNKPYVKSIETEEGDIFDCIDIYKQPAFDNPLLKNHSIQMKPSAFPKEVVNPTSPPARPSAQGLREGCPFGTVPSRGQAFVQIGSGPGVQVNTIQFGWLAYPKIFGDNKTRTFASWTAGKNGCFNTFCSGFVQVNPTYPLGYVFNEISIYGGEQYAVEFIIFKDPKSGNWWLAYNELDQTVGYWPNSLFTSLSSSASEISWGGGVYSDSNEASPPMGSGHFAEEGFKKAAYLRDIHVVDESNNMVFPEENLLHYFTDNPKCYSIAALDVKDEGIHHAFSYGGPGGSCGD
ncbi:hypothetical protein SLA2020_411930 [Shorea laevis]